MTLYNRWIHATDHEIEVYAERRGKWRTALRSGKYEQGEGYLCTVDNAAVLDFDLPTLDGIASTLDTGAKKYCCLGVAAEMFAPAIDLTWERTKYATSFSLSDKSDKKSPENRSSSNQLLTTTMQAYLGLNDDSQSILVAANDGGLKFERIASIVGHLPYHTLAKVPLGV